LRTLPWEKVNIRILLVEMDHVGKIFKGSPKELNKLLKQNGYKYLKTAGVDEIYVSNDFKKIRQTKSEL
jgi:hypothetical protein